MEVKSYDWQKRALDILDDVDVLEVIAPRGSGKSELGQMFLNKGTTKIIITPIPRASDYFYDDDYLFVRKFDDLQKLRGINREDIRVLIDEMFMTDVRMSHLDKVLGTDYKLLAIGTKRIAEDTFMIPFSKKLLVTAFATINANGKSWLDTDANSFELGTNGYYEVM